MQQFYKRRPITSLDTPTSPDVTTTTTVAVPGGDDDVDSRCYSNMAASVYESVQHLQPPYNEYVCQSVCLSVVVSSLCLQPPYNEYVCQSVCLSVVVSSSLTSGYFRASPGIPALIKTST